MPGGRPVPIQQQTTVGIVIGLAMFTLIGGLILAHYTRILWLEGRWSFWYLLWPAPPMAIALGVLIGAYAQAIPELRKRRRTRILLPPGEGGRQAG